MSVVRTRKNHKLVRNLGLLASASIMSMMMAGEAQAACTVSPSQPLTNVTTSASTINCTGATTGQPIVVVANGVAATVTGAGSTYDNATVTMDGDINSFLLDAGASANNLTVNMDGTLNSLQIGGNVTNLESSLQGLQTNLTIQSTGSVTLTPTRLFMLAGAGEVQTFSLMSGGTLTSTGNNGSAYLLTADTGNQTFSINGTVALQSNGLFINAGDGEDIINVGAAAVFSNGGVVHTINGGAGNDRLILNGAGSTPFATIGVERLDVLAGSGNTRVLDGAGSFTEVNILSGRVVASDPQSLGVATSLVTISNGAVLTLDYFATSGVSAVNNSFAGSGTIQHGNFDNYTYGGSSAGFTGVFNLADGVATIVSNDAFGSAQIVNGDEIQFDAITLGNNIDGTGFIRKIGSGTGIMTGTNTYTGGTLVDDGTLRINNGSALGSGVVTLSSNALLLLDMSTNQTLTNDIIGSGIVLKSGAGTVDLTGNNNYSGNTSLQGGSIRVDGFARLGTGTVFSSNGTSLILNYNGAAQLVQTSPTFMTGGGQFVKEGTGSVVMSVTSNYTGGTIIRAGNLVLNNGDALGTGDIQIDSGAELGIGGVILNNNLTGSGLVRKTSTNLGELYGNNSGFTGTIIVEDGTLFAVNGNAFGAGTLQIDGGTNVQLNGVIDSTVVANLSGAGGFEKLGGGIVTLSGNGNAFAGAITITGGTLQIEGSQNVGNSSPITIGNSGTLLLNTAGNTNLVNSITGGGNLVKTGVGTVFLTGANNYSGGTDIQQGAIRVTDVSFLGSNTITVQSGAALDLAIAGAQTLNQAISGMGILRKSDVGDLTLLSNGLAGVDIVGGRVIVNSSAALGGGAVTTAAGTRLVFNNSTTEVMTNVISGDGGLTKDGTGVLAINNANSYTGGTQVLAGRIVANDSAAFGIGTVTIASGAEIGIGGVTIANNITGGGRVVKTSSNTGSLTGTNTHMGGVDIQAGILDVVGNGSLGTGAVSIASGAALNYTNTTASTFSNGLSGAGTFNKLGTGQLTFANNFTLGALSLQAGRTRMNVVGTTNVTVGTAATLDGTGRIIGNLTNNGIVAPGNSIGTLTVQGNYTHNSGAVLEIEFDAAGNIDLLDVTGNATLNGGIIRFVSIGGAEGQGGTFLRTGGTLTGTFATVETVGALLPLSVVYEPNRAFMAPSILTARPSTFNAQSMAAADTALGFIDSMGVGEVRHGNGNRFWLNGFGAWGSRSASGSTLAYDHDTRGMSGGVNVDVGESVTLGAAVGWAKGDITLGSGGGGGDQSSILGSINARYAGTGFTLAGGMVYGKIDQDTLRNVSFNGFTGSVDGSTDAKIFGAFAELGLPLGSAGGWAFNANARGSYIKHMQDGYTESGTSPLRLVLGDLDTSTLEGQAKLTAKTSLWDKSNGGEESLERLDLRVDLGGRYLGTLGDREIPVTFAVSSAGIVLQGDTRNTLQGLFGLGLDYTISSGATFSFGYKGEVGKTDRHALQAGVSFSF